jgi:hypothetical protein
MESRILVARFFVLLGIASALGAGTPELAGRDVPQPKALPSVEQVMDRYVDALGGRDAIFKHKSMTVREKLEVQGLSLDRVTYYKDGKSHEELSLPNGGQYQSGYDGAVAWEMSPGGGPTLIQGDEAESKVRDADMYYPARVLDYFSSMQVVDVAEFEGHTCYHLKGTNKWGKINEHFYDTKTGLLVGYRFDSAWRGGAGDESAVFTDYKDFGGWLIPTRIAHKEPKRTLTEVVSAVTFDDVADSVFNLPDGVKALIGKEH